MKSLKCFKLICYKFNCFYLKAFTTQAFLLVLLYYTFLSICNVLMSKNICHFMLTHLPSEFEAEGSKLNNMFRTQGDWGHPGLREIFINSSLKENTTHIKTKYIIAHIVAQNLMFSVLISHVNIVSLVTLLKYKLTTIIEAWS